MLLYRRCVLAVLLFGCTSSTGGVTPFPSGGPPFAPSTPALLEGSRRVTPAAGSPFPPPPAPDVVTLEPFSLEDRTVAPGDFYLQGAPPEGTFVAAFRGGRLEIYRNDGLRLADLGISDSAEVHAGESVYFSVRDQPALLGWWPALGSKPRLIAPNFDSWREVSPDGQTIALLVLEGPSSAGLFYGPRDGALVRLGTSWGSFGFAPEVGHFYYYLSDGIIRRIPAGGTPADAEQVCAGCSFYGFSAGGSMVLRREQFNMIVAPTTSATASPVYTFPTGFSSYFNAYLGLEPFVVIVHGDGDSYDVTTVRDYRTGVPIATCDSDGMGVSRSLTTCFTGSTVSCHWGLGLDGRYFQEGELFSFEPDDRYVAADLHLFSLSCAGSSWTLWVRTQFPPARALPSGANGPVAWVDTERLLFYQGSSLMLLDTRALPWTIRQVAPLVTQFVYAPRTRTLFYAIRDHGAQDALHTLVLLDR